MIYQERTYRNRLSKTNLVSCRVHVQETDMFISGDLRLEAAATQSVFKHRKSIEEYIRTHPPFLSSFQPLPNDDLAPFIVKDMLEASRETGVGPMAAVAGAIAQYVACDLMEKSKNVIVENGGDIFLKSNQEIRVGVFAGDSPLSYKLSFKIMPQDTPVGICTSSATVGHSFSFGKADAVCIVSESACLADAAATAVGNLVKNKQDIKKAIKRGSMIKGVKGILIIVGDKLGIYGNINMV
jgi:hypothetical protein